jgi:cytoskeletal protein RodZ
MNVDSTFTSFNDNKQYTRRELHHTQDWVYGIVFLILLYLLIWRGGNAQSTTHEMTKVEDDAIKSLRPKTTPVMNKAKGKSPN